MNKKLKIALYIILALVIIIAGFSIWYLTDYSHADASVNAYLNGTENVSVEKIDNGLFLDGPGNESALIFYPGAKIEYTAYLPLFTELANDGVDCFIVEMPFNLAFFGLDSADSIVSNSNFTYDKWYISGHSLGGVVASSYVNKTDNIDGLILLASYPTQEINKPVLSIYGSNDKVFTIEKYNEAKPLIKGNFSEFIIDGGNHGQFAYYGNQSGDGIANISASNQQSQCVSEMVKFIENYT